MYIVDKHSTHTHKYDVKNRKLIFEIKGDCWTYFFSWLT